VIAAFDNIIPKQNKCICSDSHRLISGQSQPTAAVKGSNYSRGPTSDTQQQRKLSPGRMEAFQGSDYFKRRTTESAKAKNASVATLISPLTPPPLLVAPSGLADREPCPWRIIDDIGGAFAMGLCGGGLFHTFKGAYTAPKGSRLQGSIAAVKTRGPVLGGNFAVWGGLFACCDCSLTAIRRKEDPWNSICSGAITGGILASRAGVKAAGTSALIGGVLLALIEGMGIMITKMTAPAMPTEDDYNNPGGLGPPTNDVTAPPDMIGLGSGGSIRRQPTPRPAKRNSDTTFDTEQMSGFDKEENTLFSTGSSNDGLGGEETKGGGGWFGFGK